MEGGQIDEGAWHGKPKCLLCYHALEYITACRRAHEQGIDFSECSKHAGVVLPLHPVMSDYINEKLWCIFSGQKVQDVAAHAVDA